MDFIEGEKAKYPEIAAYYESFGELYQQKLWHQLSAALFEFLFLKVACLANDLLSLQYIHPLNILSLWQVLQQPDPRAGS